MALQSPSMALTLVALLGATAQWVAWRLGIPAVISLSAAGLLAGPVFGVLDPAAAFGDLLQPFVGLAVSIILFEGGLRLRFSELQHAASASAIKRLCSVGLLVSWVLGAAAAHGVGGLSMPVALLFGAILVVTGPTVIVPLLRHARLERRTASLFKWEGIVNDPFGALLAVLVFEFYGGASGGISASEVGADLALALVVGGGLGWLGGWALARAFHRGAVPEYQKAPCLLAAVLVVASLSNAAAHESGLLAATVMGVVLGNAGLASLDDLTRFKESVTIFLVSAVFIVLTAGLDPNLLSVLDLRAAALLATVLFVVRPLSVLAATWGTGITGHQRLLLMWIAPRGVVAAAVAGVFGPKLAAQGHPDAAALLPLVFATVLLTVLLHGLSIGWLARRLGLSAGGPGGLLIVGASGWSTELGVAAKALGLGVVVADTSWRRLSRPRLSGLDTHYGEVLSEAAETSLPLHVIDLVLAATDNDAYNGLVSVRFAPELGRDKVWQLASPELDVEHPLALAVGHRGRIALADDADLVTLDERLAEGWSFQTTRLTGEFGYDDWRAQLGEQALPVLMLRGAGGLRLHGPRFPLEPTQGDTLIVFTPPRVYGARDRIETPGKDASRPSPQAEPSATPEAPPVAAPGH